MKHDDTRQAIVPFRPPLVYNVPVRETKGGSKVETFTIMFRRELHIKKNIGREDHEMETVFYIG